MSVTIEKPDREVLAQASVWLARLHAEDCSPGDRQGFAQWLAETPAHRAAFEKVTDVFDAVGGARTQWPDAVEETAAEDSPARSSRRGFLLGAGVVATGVGATAWQAAFAGTVETGFAERRSLTLDDRSSLTLDAETRVREPWLRDRRLELLRGRVSVQARAAATPFTIDAEPYRLSGSAMDADIALERDALTVSVMGGALSVERAGRPPVQLAAGQRLLPDGTVDRPAMAAVMAWRRGQLVFDGTPLETACAQLNRYDQARLVVAPGLARAPISGTFTIGQNAEFAEAIAQLLPVQVVAQDGALLLRAGPKE